MAINKEKTRLQNRYFF